MMNASFKPPAPKETPATLADVLGVQAALSAHIEEETAAMETMQIAKVGEMQERKLKLIALLERYTRYLKAHPETLKSSSVEEKRRFESSQAAFERIMKKNYDMLLIARAVNGAVVKCVMHTVTQNQSNPVYNARGGATEHYRAPVSVTLNQMV